ncbi:MAG: CoA transferase [Dehalococcoidia bacterium]
MTTLSDLRILDLSDGLAGAYCTYLFASYGADVIAIEPPSGHTFRHAGGLWDQLGAGKRSITLDIRAPSGRDVVRKIVEGANVVVETFTPGVMSTLGLSFADLHGIKRRIILTSITPSGQGVLDGPRDDLDHQAAYLSGLNAFTATAIAAHNADAYEVPQHIDISAAECAALAAATGPGNPEALDPGMQLFRMSEVEHDILTAPILGEHTVSFLCEELGFDPHALPILRAAGVI